MIYKILRQAEWEVTLSQGQLTGAPVDIADGYIHFSTSAQVRETAARHFPGDAELVLLAVDPRRLGAALRWEPSRGGDVFPHLYAALPVDFVSGIYKLPLAEDGVHLFPPHSGV